MGEEGSERRGRLENFTKTTWQVGEYYRVYGDAYGTYNGMPWLIGRYTYLD